MAVNDGLVQAQAASSSNHHSHASVGPGQCTTINCHQKDATIVDDEHFINNSALDGGGDSNLNSLSKSVESESEPFSMVLMNEDGGNANRCGQTTTGNNQRNCDSRQAGKVNLAKQEEPTHSLQQELGTSGSCLEKDTRLGDIGSENPGGQTINGNSTVQHEQLIELPGQSDGTSGDHHQQQSPTMLRLAKNGQAQVVLTKVVMIADDDRKPPSTTLANTQQQLPVTGNQHPIPPPSSKGVVMVVNHNNNNSHTHHHNSAPARVPPTAKETMESKRERKAAKVLAIITGKQAKGSKK